MDNPNNSGRLRRHNSLPNKFHLPSALMPSQIRLKRNPYVGSFRHSPPTSLCSIEACAEMPHPRLSPSMLLKSSPYIGWFRHAPPAKITMQNIFSQRLALLDTRCQDKSFVREPQDQVTYDLANIINGRLRGGGNDKHCSLSSTHESDILRCAQHALQESYTESASGTVNMLARIGSWLLFPLAYDSESAGYKTFRHQGFDPIPEDSQSWTSSVDESSLADVLESEADSDGDTPGAVALTSSKAGTPVGCNSQPLDISVSNVAEAYYAHQAIGQVDDLSPDAHRLDYVITQMDIARMARNASRHLDVESILTLPTMTYKCLASAESSAQETHESWSFVMVTDDRAHCRTRQQGNFCVICMDHFVDGDRLRVLPCNHSFHVGCIDRWLSGSHSNFECFTSGCPTCKKSPLGAKDSHSNDGSVPSWAFAQLGDALARSVSTP